MSTLPEQLSAVRKSQVEAQLAFFQNFTSKAVEGAEKLIALNLNTTRASLEKSSAAVRQLIAAKDPRDLLALTTQSQENFDTLLAYGRELFSIATGAQAALLQPAAPGPVPAFLTAPSDTAAATPESFPEVALAKPIAKAGAKAMPKPAAAPVPLEPEPVVVAGLEPVDALAPLHADADQEQLDSLTPKARKKK